jgi:hypothetical protein
MVARKGKIIYSDAIGFQDKGANYAHEARFDLPHLLDDQAARLGGGDDAGRRRRHPAHRSDLQIPARLQDDAR